MNTIETIKTRRSIRNFDPEKELTDDQISKLLESARLAPSAGNLQSWYFYIVKNKEKKEEIANAALNQQFIATAPLVIISCADLKRSESKYGDRGRELYAIQDATIATQNIWLTAAELGLGAAWVGAFVEDEIRKILTIPANLRPIAIMPIGYPKESPEPPERRRIEEISKIVD